MRFLVCLLGLLASSLMAGVGVFFMLGDVSLAWCFEQGHGDLLREIYITESSTESLTNISFANGALVILVAAAYGFLASLFILFRCGKQAAALLIVTALGAGLVQPVSLIAGLPAIFVGFLALFVGPLPLNPPQEKDADDDEEEEEKPKAKPKPMPKPAKVEDEDEEEEEMPKPKAKAKAKPKKVVDEDDE